MGFKDKLRVWKEERAVRAKRAAEAKAAAEKAYYEEHTKARVKAAQERARLEQEHKMKLLKQQYTAKAHAAKPRKPKAPSFQESARNVAGGGFGLGLMMPQQPRIAQKHRKKKKKRHNPCPSTGIAASKPRMLDFSGF